MRLRLADRVLLVGLLAVWAPAYLLHLSQVARGELAWLPVHVEVSDVGTRVAATWPGTAAGEVLLPGDAIESIAGRPADYTTRLDFVAHAYAATTDHHFVAGIGRDGAVVEREVPLVPIPWPWRKALLAGGMVLIGAATLWQTRGRPEGRLFFAASIAWALHWGDFFGHSEWQTRLGVLSFGVGTALIGPLMFLVLFRVPAETARNDTFSRWAPWVFLANGPIVTTWAFGTPLPPAWGQPLAMIATFVLVVSTIGLFTRNYRRSGRAGRRQLKWVMLGFWVGLVPGAFAAVVAFARPELWWLYEAALALGLAIPVALLIALTRDNLFDVDRLITATGSYTALSVLLLGGFLWGLPRLAEALGEIADPSVVQSAGVLFLAAGAIPVKRWLEPRLETFLFPERRELEARAEDLHRALDGPEKPADLFALFGSRLEDWLAASCTVIYARAGDAFAPVFAHGRAIAPAFPTESAFIAHLERVGTSVDAGRGRSVEGATSDRAALEAMGAELILPITSADGLEAFVCLGEKASGDVYTRTDRTLLRSLTDKVSDVLHRFDREDLAREQAARTERLRRYVPEVVAESIDTAGRADPGEVTVTILFVDIRGYTNLSEGQRPQAIFDIVSRYTSVGTRVVREHGGAVVEFSGDGLLAVFGAPIEIQHKERAAVAAARAMLPEIAALEAKTASGEPVRLSAGIGIATGPAYVGSIRAADRDIWCAIGNTTNLAARLQSLTRDLSAAIAIDEPTQTAAPAETADFERHTGQRIKGRSGFFDIYALALAPTPEEVGK